MHLILESICERLGDSPRRFRPDDWPHLLIPRPTWITGDEMEVIFDDQRFLLKEGNVVWGHIVQANQLVLGPGPRSHPATVIYSRHPDVLDEPKLLEDIAFRAAQLKSRRDPRDSDEDRYARMLRDEHIRAMRWRVPDRLTDGIAVYSTSAMISRRHIPGRILARNLFPLLVHRDTVATIMVPHEFWPARFRDEWADRAASIAANLPWITITDEAADVMERVAREEGERRDWSIRMWIERDPDGGLDRVRHDFDRDYDPDRDRVFHSNGIRIVVARADAAELRGFTMHAGADEMYWLG